MPNPDTGTSAQATGTTAEGSFANPSGSSGAEIADYVRNLLALLGDREPLAVVEAMPSELAAAVAGLDDEAAARPEAPGKWSVNEVVQHLADSELVWGYRLRRVIAEERPTLTGYDQDRWAERLGYRQGRIAEALPLFTALRQGNLRLLRRLAPADFDRVGVHAERGEETAAHMLKLYAAHDLVHLRQIARIRGVVG